MGLSTVYIRSLGLSVKSGMKSPGLSSMCIFCNAVAESRTFEALRRLLDDLATLLNIISL
jgi:hypothetical protein